MFLHKYISQTQFMVKSIFSINIYIMIKQFLILLSINLILVLGCNKNDNSNYIKAKILGSDLRLCACCGGYFMLINNDSTFRAISIDGIYKDSTLKKGMEYWIQYKSANTTCGSEKNLIKITDLKIH